MSITKQSSDRLAARLAAIAPEIKAKLVPALNKSAEEVARDARQLAEASRRTGETIETITVTPPGGTSPAYAQGGASVTLHELQAAVTVGSPEVRTAHLVEFGSGERQHADGTPTGTMPAKPFMLPSWRLNKPRIERRLQRAIREGIKAGAGGTDGT